MVLNRVLDVLMVTIVVGPCWPPERSGCLPRMKGRATQVT